MCFPNLSLLPLTFWPRRFCGEGFWGTTSAWVQTEDLMSKDIFQRENLASLCWIKTVELQFSIEVYQFGAEESGKWDCLPRIEERCKGQLVTYMQRHGGSFMNGREISWTLEISKLPRAPALTLQGWQLPRRLEIMSRGSTQIVSRESTRKLEIMGIFVGR